MDNAELRSLLELHHRDSYGWALSCCSRDPGVAETVLQTVYLKVLQSKSRFDGRASFKTWLFSVIRTTAADYRRRRILRSLRLIRFEDTVTEPTCAGNADAAIYQSELQKLFQQALAALPRRQREVLQLVFYHDLSIAEAAEVMRVSTGSARTHYERGKKQLRQWMTKAKVFDEQELERKLGRRENQQVIL